MELKIVDEKSFMRIKEYHLKRNLTTYIKFGPIAGVQSCEGQKYCTSGPYYHENHLKKNTWDNNSSLI